MREIAQEAQVGLSNIYNYFKSKDDIFCTVVRPVISAFERMLHEHHGRYGADIMEMYSTEYLRYVKEKHPQMNINVTYFSIHLHTAWMFTMFEELIMHRVGIEDLEQIVTEYITFEVTGWRELMKI